jgi:hypothetical protein
MNYQVSNLGRLRNVVTGKMLSHQTLNNKGYPTTRLCKDGHVKNMRIHQVVANEFIPKPDTNRDLVVDHIDRDKTNNKLCNLRWVSQSQNQWNRSKMQTRNTTSRYIGVYFHRRRKLWRACVRAADGGKCCIGQFQHEKDAARAYNAKAYELRGNFAVLNDISDDED